MGVCVVWLSGICNGREKSWLAGAYKKQPSGDRTSGIGKNQPLGNRSRRRTLFPDQRVFLKLSGKYDDAMWGNYAVRTVCHDIICVVPDRHRDSDREEYGAFFAVCGCLGSLYDDHAILCLTVSEG